jgi:two-component system, OmpR family, sensor histidine kinase MprB
VVSVRPTQFERALGNLLDNAAKWSPADTGIEVRIEGGELVVADRGPGMAADELPRIFDRFYRSPAARATPGSGLGLAIVKQAVEANGGRVFARNGPGGGAEIGFSLPTA